MSFSLALPSALLLGGLILLPIIAHMAKQQPRIQTPFGAMLLLERVVKRLRRRRRLKDWLLFLMRLLIVLGLVAGAAGPTCQYEGAQPLFGATGRVVLVLDRSMSMSLEEGGHTLLAHGRSQALSVLSELPDETLVGAVVFDAEAVRLSTALSADKSRIRSRIESLQPSYRGSNLRAGLLEARKLLAGEPGEVFVFSDEAGPRIVTEASHELKLLVEKGSAVIPRTVAAEPARNVAVTNAEYGDGLEGGVVSITLSNFGKQSVEVPCVVELPDGQSIPIFAELPPEGEVVEEITVPREALGGVGRATCDDPDLTMDDTRYFHLPRVGASRVLVVDGEPGDTPSASEVYYLERALAPWGGTKSGLTPDVVTPAGLEQLNTERHQVLFLANVSDPRPFGPELVEFVRGGGGLVIAVGDNVTAERYNSALGTILPSFFRKTRALAAPGEEGVPIQMPNVGHPLFETFKRSGRLGFQRIRSHRVVTLEPYQDTEDVKTLLSYQGGIPALVEKRVGKGRVLLWTSSVDWDWSSLPLQATFMPLMQRMVGYLGGEAGGVTGRMSGLVGETIEVPLPDLNLEPEILGPDGSPVRSQILGSTIVFVPERPGAYQVKVEDVPPMAWIAVNVDVIESDVRPYLSLAAAEAEVAPELFFRKVDVGPYLFALVMLLMVMQALVAVRGNK